LGFGGSNCNQGACSPLIIACHLNILQIAAYLSYHRLEWLCWTAASHLIVFRLVRKPQTQPYLVISDVVQVDDTRVQFQNPADERIGQRWMTCIVGCCLGGIATASNGMFSFDVEDVTSSNGVPKLTPAELEEDYTSSSSGTSQGTSDASWTPKTAGSAKTHIAVSILPVIYVTNDLLRSIHTGITLVF
jgi:hypothetical protein